MDNFVLTEKGVVIKITNTSAEQVLTNDNGFISPTLKLSEEVVHKEIIPAFKIKIPAYVSYGVFDIAPGDSISFIVKKPNEVFYYIGLQDARMEGISISVTPVTDSVVLQDKVITPTTEEQVVTADEGYNGLGTVTVNAMNLGTKTITASDTYNAADDGFDGYSSVEVNISVPTPTPGVKSGAIIRDYDGSVIASYTPAQFAALSAYPAQPVHTGLTGQGYNWSLANAKAYVAKYGYVEVGATYTTDDGKTRYYIALTEDNIEITFYIGLNGTAIIDWGDDSETDTITGEDIDTQIDTPHTYTTAGKYIITINVTDGSAALMSSYLTDVYKAEIGSGVVSIGSGAFSGYSSEDYNNYFNSITIPNTVMNIAGGAFNYCNNQLSIVIPNSITVINNLFCNNGLISVYLPDTINTINGHSFESTKMKSIIIPDSCLAIGDYAFHEADIEFIIIPDSVTSLGQYVFDSCTYLSYAYLSSNVDYDNVYYGIFTHCPSLKTIVIPNNFDSSIGDYLYIESIIYKNDVTSIYNIFGSDTLYCSKSFVIPDSVTYIGDNTFDNSYNSFKYLESITIPSSVTSIGTGAFQYCSSLSSITIPEGVTSIGSNTFQGCCSLTSITIPEGVTEIGDYAFQDCYSLSSITFEPTIPPTISLDEFENINPLCTIYVPQGTLEAYTTAENYPDPTLYTYIERPAT